MAEYKLTKHELFAAQVPAETRSYKPVPHILLDELIKDSISTAGFRVTEAVYSGAREGTVANAKYLISDIKDEDMGLQIGWQNSYNKTLTLKFAIGSKVFICGNGVIVGNMGAFKRKHTGDIRDWAPEKIEEAILRVGDSFETMRVQKNAMKEINISPRIRAELIGRLYLEEKIIKTQQLGYIRDEIANPSYDYGASNSMWETYQHVTHSLKGIHPSLYMDTHIKAHKFFNAATMVRETIDVAPISSLPDSTKQITLLDEIMDRENEME